MAAPTHTTTPSVAPPRAGLRATVLLLAPQMAAACASLAVNVLAARTLGPSGRGHIALLLQVAYLSNMLAQAGTDRAYPVHAPPGRPPRAALADTARLVAPTGVLVVAAAVPVVAVSGGNRLLSVAAFLVAAVAMIASGAARTAAAATGTARPYTVGAITGQGLLAAAAVGLTVAHVDAPAVWLAAYAAALACAPAVTWLLLPRTDRAARVDLREARRLGLRLLPAGLATMVMLRADRLMLPWLAGLDQLGVYIIVATVAELAAWPVQTWVDANTSRWHRQHLAGTLHHARPLMGAAAYSVCAGLLLCAAAPLIRPVFGHTYTDAARLLPLLAAATVAYSISRVAIGLSTATGRARTALTADLPAMLAALGCYLLLIPHWGAHGAAAGSAVAYTVSAVLAVTALTRTRTGR